MDNAMSSSGPTRMALGGTAILMACACGVATNSVKVGALYGAALTTKIVHPAVLLVAVVLITTGLWRLSSSSGKIAVGAFVTLGLGALLTPPLVMTAKPMAGMDVLPWNATHMLGASLYLLAAGLLAHAFWRTFPTSMPRTTGVAMGGMAAAVGCTCCLVEGAASGMVSTAGSALGLFHAQPDFFYVGLAITAVALYRLGGLRSAMWIPFGAIVIKFGPEALKITGDWEMRGIAMRFIPAYLTTIAGAGALLYGFVAAYAVSCVRDREAHPVGARDFAAAAGD